MRCNSVPEGLVTAKDGLAGGAILLIFCGLSARLPARFPPTLLTFCSPSAQRCPRLPRATPRSGSSSRRPARASTPRRAACSGSTPSPAGRTRPADSPRMILSGWSYQKHRPISFRTQSSGKSSWCDFRSFSLSFRSLFARSLLSCWLLLAHFFPPLVLAARRGQIRNEEDAEGQVSIRRESCQSARGRFSQPPLAVAVARRPGSRRASGRRVGQSRRDRAPVARPHPGARWMDEESLRPARGGSPLQNTAGARAQDRALAGENLLLAPCCFVNTQIDLNLLLVADPCGVSGSGRRANLPEPRGGAHGSVD